MTLERRVTQLEAALGARAGSWFDLATWQEERSAGVTLEERERRRLAEHPEQAAEIRAHFARVRERVALLDRAIEREIDNFCKLEGIDPADFSPDMVEATR